MKWSALHRRKMDLHAGLFLHETNASLFTSIETNCSSLESGGIAKKIMPLRVVKTPDLKSEGNRKKVGDFYNSIPVHQTPPEFVQVCYVGVFAASVPSIKKRDMAFWAHIERVLSRGDNIEEGH